MTLARIAQIEFYASLEREGWVPLKQWRYEEGERQGCTEDRILKRMYQGHYPHLEIKKINRKMVFCRP